MEAGTANERVKNYELTKHICVLLFQKVIKIPDREIFMIYILAKLQYKNIKVVSLKAVLDATSKKWGSTDILRVC